MGKTEIEVFFKSSRYSINREPQAIYS